MPLVLIGLNHRSAPVAVREKLSIAAGELAGVLHELAGMPEVDECWMLSTCNRVEVLASTKPAGGRPDPVERFLGSRCGIEAEVLGPYLYRLEDDDAVAHLFRVASGLDSLIVGEPQILGQTKDAYAAARAAGTLGHSLEPLLQRTFAVAKRVRSETEIGRNAVSVAYAAVELAQQIFGELAGRSILLVGTGKMAGLAARHLIAQGVGETLVASRTLSHAVSFAESLGAQALGVERIPEALARVDIVIGSTAAPHPVILREHVEAAMRQRRNRRLFLIDIAVPRDVEASAGELDDVYLYNIDDLQSVVETNKSSRLAEARAAEAIVKEEAGSWRRRIIGSAAGGTIAALLARAESIREQELRRVRSRLGELTPRQEEQVEALARALVAKLVHTPVSSLRRQLENGGDPALLGLARALFDLDGGTAPENLAAPEGPGAKSESREAADPVDADRPRPGKATE